QHPIPHRPPGDVKLPDMWFLQCCFPCVGADSGNESILTDSDEKVSMEQEAEAAEHLLLFDILLASQDGTDTSSEGFIKRHGRLRSFNRFRRLVCLHAW